MDPPSFVPSNVSAEYYSSSWVPPPITTELGESTSDFVKKLFKMLETPGNQTIVHWNPTGDAFVVQDMNGFTTKILPKLFKHSNFASFVRQLNKYDFHKVKSEDGDGSWTFRHPDFTASNKVALENIKRKIPSTGRKGAGAHAHTDTAPAPSTSSSRIEQSGDDNNSGEVLELRGELGRLKNEFVELKGRMHKLEGLLNSFTPPLPPPPPPPSPPIQSQFSGFELGKESINWMGSLTASSSTPSGSVVNPFSVQQTPTSNQLFGFRQNDNDNDNDTKDEVVMPSPLPPPPPANKTLEVYTVGGLMNNNNNQQQQQGGRDSLRVRRTAWVPGWSVPPKVLLVDDDEVARRLSKKFLEVFGCTTDVAIDGIGAVNKMNFEKYDLVLMDIVMPKLDGVSATNMIRKFDGVTPIISMTSNSRPDEVISYYSSGMNDILSKPFTKQRLFDMLEKHLHHLHNINLISNQLPPTIASSSSAASSLVPSGNATLLPYFFNNNNNNNNTNNNNNNIIMTNSNTNIAAITNGNGEASTSTSSSSALNGYPPTPTSASNSSAPWDSLSPGMDIFGDGGSSVNTGGNGGGGGGGGDTTTNPVPYLSFLNNGGDLKRGFDEMGSGEDGNAGLEISGDGGMDGRQGKRGRFEVVK